MDTLSPKTFDMGALLLGPTASVDIRHDPLPRNPNELPQTSPFPSPSTAPQSLGEPASEQAIAVALRWTLERESRARLWHEQSWIRSWELYNGRYSFFAGKAKWQSKKSLPRVFSATHRMAAMLSQFVTTTNNWFAPLAAGSIQQVFLNFITDIMRYYLEHPDVCFSLKFYDLMMVGALSQIMGLTVTMDQTTPTPTLRDYSPDAGGKKDANLEGSFFDALIGGTKMFTPPLPQRKTTLPRFEVCDPFRIYLDSGARDRYKIRTYRYTRGEYRAEARKNGWRYTEQVIAGAESRNSQGESPYVDMVEQRNRDNMMSMTMDERDFIHVQIFWGDLYDESGDCLFERSCAVLVNGTWLVQAPKRMSDAHGRPPLLSPAMVRVPFSPYGKSLIGVSNESVELFVEFLNLLVDYFQKMVLGMVEVDEHLLEGDANPRILYPGKVFPRSPDADPAFPTVRPVKMDEPSVQVWQFLGQIQQEINDGTAMASGMTGQQRVRGRVSAMEYSRRQADSGVLINSIFKTIEDQLLGPMLYMLLMNILQYLPQEEWDDLVRQRAEVIEGEDGETLKTLIGKSAEWRIENLGYNLRFRVRVFSAIADRQAELEKATMIMNLIKQQPAALAHVKWWPFLRRIFEALGWDPEEYVAKGPPQPQDPFNPLMLQQWQQQLEALLQQLKQIQTAPGAPGAANPSAAPGGGAPQPAGTPEGMPGGTLGVGQPMPGGPPNPLAAILAATAAGAGGQPMTQPQQAPGFTSLAGGTSH